MNWIKIEDQLPPNNQRVLLAGCNDVLKPYFDTIQIGRISNTLKGITFYLDSDDSCFGKGHIDPKATHWMELPIEPNINIWPLP